MNYLKHLSFLMLATTIFVMVVATFVEKTYGSAGSIYGSWWFCLMWALSSFLGVAYCFRRRIFRRPVTFLLHVSLVVILAGACVTHLIGRQGLVHLRVGVPELRWVDDESRVHTFPFRLTLDAFTLQNYPGTETPMDYISELSVIEEDALSDTLRMRISMNHIGQYRHYRFCQTSYDEDLQGSILSVSFDPWGIGITYVGYGLLFLSMLLLLVLSGGPFRRALKRLSLLAVICMVGLPEAQATPVPKVLPDTLADRFGDLNVYYNGRICPLQTVAIDFTSKLYGKSSYKGYSPNQVFSGWVLFPASWVDQPRKERKGAEQDAVVQMLFAGEFMHIYPYQGHWYSQGENLPTDMDEQSWFFVKKSLDYVGELAVTRQYDQLSYTLSKIRRYQEQHTGPGELPDRTHFEAEKIYNHYNIVRPLAMLLLTLGLLALIRKLRWWIWVVDLLALFYLAVMFCLRYYVSGHLPLATGHETMQFLALCALSMTLWLSRRMWVLLPSGTLIAGFAMLVSMFGEANPQVTPLIPVLQSPLLSLHVCIIMIAYGLLAFCFLLGIAGLYQQDEERRRSLQHISQVFLYPALFCLAAGIFIGAIWANVSWGRYWGWDPKEVWALVTMLVYAFAVHGESLPWFRRPRFFHLYMVLAFLSVLMTYFGVNFLLGGMHSYANT